MIAEARGNSTVTVRDTLYRVQEKLGVSNKQGLVIWAVRNGLLDDVEVGRRLHGQLLRGVGDYLLVEK